MKSDLLKMAKAELLRRGKLQNMKVGFTGTRQGMTQKQQLALLDNSKLDNVLQNKVQ